MRVSLIFAWYDLWMGAYWDRNNRCLYLFPLPMIGMKIQIMRAGWTSRLSE